MINLLQSDRAKRYLICDARHPLITASQLWDELLLYNLSPSAREELYSLFEALTGRSIDASSRTDQLSGGQKVLLMTLLALLCPAPRLLFLNLWHSLDLPRREQIKALIDRHSTGKEILTEDSPDAC